MSVVVRTSANDPATLAPVIKSEIADLDPNLPVARTTCSCSDFKVIALEYGAHDWAPFEFTCSVSSSGGDPTITLTGTTSGLDASKDYVIYFADYDNCETCQQKWIFHADDDNLIGDTNEPADRWV